MSKSFNRFLPEKRENTIANNQLVNFIPKNSVTEILSTLSDVNCQIGKKVLDLTSQIWNKTKVPEVLQLCPKLLKSEFHIRR